MLPSEYNRRKLLTTLNARLRLQQLTVTIADSHDNITNYYYQLSYGLNLRAF